MTTEAQDRRRALKVERVQRREEDARAVADQQRRDKYVTAFKQVQRAVAGFANDGPWGEAVAARIIAAMRQELLDGGLTNTQLEGAAK